MVCKAYRIQFCSEGGFYIQTLAILKKTGTWSGSHPVYGVDHPVAGAHVCLHNLGLDTASVNLVIKILVHVSTMWSL